MKKTAALIFLFCMAAAGARAQFPDADTCYFFLFGNTEVEEFRDVCNHTTDSGYVAVGSTSSFTNGESDVYLVKTDWKGTTLWSRHIGSPFIENGYAIKETFDHGFIIGGYTNNTAGGDYDMYLVKTDSLGWVQWEKKYGGADWDFMYSLAIAPDSGFILCGETYSFGNVSSDVYLVRTDKSGNLVWEKNYGGVNKDGGRKVAITHDSDFIVCGYTESFGAGGRDAYLLKIDLNGDTLPGFTKSFGGPLDEEFNCVLEHKKDSGFVAIGYSESFTPEQDKEVYLLKTDKQGALLWSYNYGHPTGEDIGYSVTEITYNFLWYVATTAYGAGKNDVASVIASELGIGFWSLYAPTYGGTEDDLPYANTLTLRQHYLIAGATASFGNLNKDAMLILNDSTLNQGHYPKIITSSDTLVSVSNNTAQHSFSIFPNPSPGKFYLSCLGVSLPGKFFQVGIYDLQGRELHSTRVSAEAGKVNAIDPGILSPGLYIVKVSGEGAMTSLSLVISP